MIFLPPNLQNNFNLGFILNQILTQNIFSIIQKQMVINFCVWLDSNRRLFYKIGEVTEYKKTFDDSIILKKTDFTF